MKIVTNREYRNRRIAVTVGTLVGAGISALASYFVGKKAGEEKVDSSINALRANAKALREELAELAKAKTAEAETAPSKDVSK